MHVEQNYMSKNGIVLNYKNAEYPQYLSESIGLYMQYLLEIRDKARFRDQVEILLEHFSVFQDEHLFIKWELGENTTVGAVIDDLRIAWVLNSASQVFEEKLYMELSDKIISTVKDTMIINGRLVDFFDWHYNIAKDQLFLSYYIIEAMDTFPDYVFEPLETLIAAPFFDELYIEGEFMKASPDEVNMIDQSLIALAYFKRTGHVEPNFQQFLEERLHEDGIIFARYRRDTLERVNDNQSPATYAFLLEYFTITYQESHAATIRKLLKAMDTSNAEITHFFDFINKELALTLF